MIKIAICDDEKSVCRKMYSIVEQYLEEENRPAIIKSFCSGQEFLKTHIYFDIVFLDVEMPEMNGIETALKLRQWDVNSKIIYVTNYDKYWEKAYKVHAFDYISKPIKSSTIQNVMKEAIYYLDNKNDAPKISFRTEVGIITLALDDIYYFEYYARKIKIITVRGIFQANYTLKELYKKFGKYNFKSPHKSFIVNMLHIKYIKGFEILMDNEEIVPLAQKRAVEFKEEFNDFLQSTFDRI